jgi:pilus assembly protein CpaB
MNNRAFTISFVVAALAVLMVYSYVDSTREAYRQQYGVEKQVVVAKRDIKELEYLDETNLTTRAIPLTFVEPGTGPDPKSFIGALAIASILKDEQVTRSKITQLGPRTGLARQVAVGKRAVTVRVNDETAVAKLLKPGDRVDVLANVDPTGSGNKLAIETRIVLQDVLILATGKYVNNTVPGIWETDAFKAGEKNKVKLSEYTAFPNVTLEVDPFEAQKLVFASTQLGGVYLVLRNNDDPSKEEFPKIRMQDMMGKDGAAGGPAPAAQHTPPPAFKR